MKTKTENIENENIENENIEKWKYWKNKTKIKTKKMKIRNKI